MTAPALFAFAMLLILAAAALGPYSAQMHECAEVGVEVCVAEFQP